METAIGATIGVVGGLGGIVSTYLSYRSRNRKSTHEEFITIIDTMRQNNRELDEKVDELEDELKQVQSLLFAEKDKVSLLSTQYQLLQSAHLSLPFPQWVKSSNGVMLSLNDAYEKLFLRPIGKVASNYIGKTDADIWPEEIADGYMEADRKVSETGNCFVGEERIVIGDNDVTEQWTIVKYPRRSGDMIVGIAGIAFPKDSLQV